MDVLIVGSGGREHALGWKTAQSRDCGKIYFAPGNGGTEGVANSKNIDIAATDTKRLALFAAENKCFAVIGPELPLSLGLADAMRELGVKVFGPGIAAARLETSKAYSKWFMRKYNIPTAGYDEYADLNEAISSLPGRAYPVWVKADGLASGKGAIFGENEAGAREAIESIMREKIFGESGSKIVIEEHLEGREATLLCFVDGETILPMELSQDYKRAHDGGLGPNTGGMGCVTPVMGIDVATTRDIVEGTLEGIKAEGLDYRGMLYIGLIFTDKGSFVIEYNARFGDPETEALLHRLDTDLLRVMRETEARRLKNVSLKWKKETAVCVALASGGYPESGEGGREITLPGSLPENCEIFHAGTAKRGGKLFTTGGRALFVSALGRDLSEARSGAYGLIEKISFQNMRRRTDIGL
ncbi:MAG: phosphoribosylamine--glycine ligase [Defluviitaleaceae bacterium]|nr:phosphoribosylamine--glycine ligase [Defluviitaleaceae bacterium]